MSPICLEKFKKTLPPDIDFLYNGVICFICLYITVPKFYLKDGFKKMMPY